MFSDTKQKDDLGNFARYLGQRGHTLSLALDCLLHITDMPVNMLSYLQWDHSSQANAVANIHLLNMISFCLVGCSLTRYQECEDLLQSWPNLSNSTVRLSCLNYLSSLVINSGS